MDDKNVPTAIVELSGGGVTPGMWVVSGWGGDETMVFGLRRYYTEQLGPQMASSIIGRLTEPQSVDAGGKRFRFTLRPARAYEPYSLTLLKATHAVYGEARARDVRGLLTTGGNGGPALVQPFLASLQLHIGPPKP